MNLIATTSYSVNQVSMKIQQKPEQYTNWLDGRLGAGGGSEVVKEASSPFLVFYGKFLLLTCIMEISFVFTHIIYLVDVSKYV